MSSRSRPGVVVSLSIFLLALGAGAAGQLVRPVPVPKVRGSVASSYSVPGRANSLAWPATGQAALYLSGFGWLGSTSGESAVPIASVTKIMTALVILQAHPLALGVPGPSVTVSAAAVAVYQSERSQGDSVVPVVAGETLSELELLEGLLLPSGDNLAVLLADWQSGSEGSFVQLMNQRATSLRLRNTRFTDSSGLNPGSVSSARDLVTLATVAMGNPVFAAIVAMPTVVLPIVGAVRNYNPILGAGGVIGIKTGWTEAALGCLVFAARETVAGRPVQLVGAVLGQPGGPESGLQAAGRAAMALLTSGETELQPVQLPGAGAIVGRVTSAWGGRASIEATQTIGLIGVSGTRLAVHLLLRRLPAPLRRGQTVGSMTVITPSGVEFHQPLILTTKLADPGWEWRLARPI